MALARSTVVSAVTVATGVCFGGATAVATWGGPAPRAVVALFALVLVVVALNALVGGTVEASATATLAIGLGVVARTLAAPVLDGVVGIETVVALVVVVGSLVPGVAVHRLVSERTRGAEDGTADADADPATR